MSSKFDLLSHGITAKNIVRNPPIACLYEQGVVAGDLITSAGALATVSGEKTGRSPKDKRIVEHPASAGDVWWGPVNIKLTDASFQANRQRAIDFLSAQERLYVIDGYAGWDPTHQLKVRIICARPYHALFMHNMLIRPTAEQLASFGQPDYVIYNAGQTTADPATPGNTSKTSVAISFERGEVILLGTEYAGDVSLFFGLSGTGKTTLSADVHRRLIGDDEHCWSDDGVFNIEGGCYAKCIKLSAAKEPEIFSAVRFGAILENTVIDPATRQVDYDDDSLTENTRVSYPIEFIPRAKIPCLGGQPQNIIFLTCDAFGVLPPVSRLTTSQAMYHFISGYTAKVAGTEMGVTEPQATFSACFGAAFLVWHPTKYAEMLAHRKLEHASRTWLVNTGWTGGAYGAGSRISLAHTRAIIDAIHSGELNDAATVVDPIFGLAVPRAVSGVPGEILIPERAWADQAAYQRTARKLAELFEKNFQQYTDAASNAIRASGPKVPEGAGV